mgnify:CR=1 FL=1
MLGQLGVWVYKTEVGGCNFGEPESGRVVGKKQKSFYSGSSFTDAVDDCDLNTTCDLVTGVAAVTASEATTP